MKKRNQSALILLLLTICFISYANEKSYENGFTKQFRLGEKEFGDYFGVEHNIIYQDDYGHLRSQDEKLSDQYISSLFMESFDSKMSFFTSELPAGIFCPDKILDKHFSSLQYYFRLLALSHLFETLKVYKKLGTCSLDLEQVLKSCTPKSSWLKKVVKLAQVAPALQSSLIDESIFLPRRDKKWCANPGHRCINRKMTRKKYCEQDIKDFKLICSELDDIYAMSKLQLPYWLLKRTHVTDRFETEELALGCMKRFSQAMKHYEVIPQALSSLFEPVYESLPDSHKEGGLFAYGSLQKYGDLEKLFADSFKPSKEIIAIKEKEVRVLTRRQAPIIKRKVVSFRKLPVLKKKKSAPKKSAFFQACNQRNKYDLNEASVNMLKFHYDLVLTGKKKEQADTLLEKFRQRKVLESMKSFEKLGTNQAPVPLIFIKYLIDAKDYQGLYNIIGVLGNEFFVKNDFDIKESRCRLEKAKLIYDKTKRAWQISVIKSQKENELK